MDPHSLPADYTSRTDALFGSFVSKRRHIPLHMVQEFLDLIHRPDFNVAELTVTKAEESLTYCPNLRRQLTYAQERHIANSRPLTPPPERQAKLSLPGLPEDVLDLIGSYVASTCPSFSTVSAAQERAATTSQGRYVLHKPSAGSEALMNMSLVSHFWTFPAQRHLRRVARAAGAPALRSIIASPNAAAAIRELHVVLPPSIYSAGMQPAEDLREALFLLRVLLGKTRNLESLYFQTSTQAFSDGSFTFVSPALTEIFDELSRLPRLKRLWLTHISGPSTPVRIGDAARHLEKLYAVLPRMCALKQLWVHNWCESQLHRAVPEPFTNMINPTATDMDVDSEKIEDAVAVEQLSYRLGVGGITFADVLQLGAPVHGAPTTRPLTSLFARAAPRVTRLRLLASNLFVQGVRAPSTLLVALTPPPPCLAALELTLDGDAEGEVDPHQLSRRLLAPDAAPHLQDVALILASSRATGVPEIILPPQLRVLRVHFAKSALARTCLRSLNVAIEGETWWAAIDRSLEHLLQRWALGAKQDPESGGFNSQPALEEVRLTIDLTTSMQNEVEKGLKNEDARWEIDGPCPIPKLKDFCDLHQIAFTCYRTAMFSA